jgi:hypothetical protein
MPHKKGKFVSTPGIFLGSGDSNLADIYADLLSGGADAVSLSGNGTKVLVLTSGAIQTAAFQQGAAQGETPQTIANNASLLADIADYCTTHGIGIEVEAVLTPPDAGAFYPGTGAVNEYVKAWATAAAIAGLPITSVEDIQEVGTEDAADENGITASNLASTAASEALAVNTLINAYQTIAGDAINAADSGNTTYSGGMTPQLQALASAAALPQDAPIITANQLTLGQQEAFIANTDQKVAANLTVGDMEAGGGSATDAVLQDVAQYWTDYASIANAGTVALYGTWQNIGGHLTETNSSLSVENPAVAIPNATTVWIQGTIVDANAFDSMVDPGTLTQAGSLYDWVASSGSLPAGWVEPAGTSATPLYEILQSGSVYTYVYEQSATLSLNSAQQQFSFVTSDTGTGAEWQEWLQGLQTLASGGTIQAFGTTISLAPNQALALNVLTEPDGNDISNAQAVQQAEQQAAMLAGFGVTIDNLVNETWSALPDGVGLITSPSSWTNAEAEIAATYPLYAAQSITAEGSSGVTVTAPGQIVLNDGNTVTLGGNLSLTYNAPDSATARLAIVIIDQSGTLTLTDGSGTSGTFGGSGTFSGSGSNILVLNGDTADLANALNAIALTENNAGPDTIDIETFSINGQLSDNQISMFTQPAYGASDADIDATSNLQGWITSSATINNGTVVSEVLNWNTTNGLASPIASAATGSPPPEFVKTDVVHATLSDYDVSVSNSGLLIDGDSVIGTQYPAGAVNPLGSSYFPALAITSLIVQTTTNTFDADGYLMQSVDNLVAPDNVNGSDGSTLLQWGTQVTEFNVSGNANWNPGAQYASASSESLTLNESGQTIEALFQGGPDDPSYALDQVYDPDNTSALWEEIETTAEFNNSATYAAVVPAIITEFDTDGNPFWDLNDWGTVATATQIYGSGMSMPLGALPGNPNLIDLIGNDDTIASSAGTTFGINGTGEIVNLPGGGTLVAEAYASVAINGSGVVAWLDAYDTIAVAGSNDIITASVSSTVTVNGNLDIISGRQDDTISITGNINQIFGSLAASSVTVVGNDNTITALAGSTVTVSGVGEVVSLLSGGTIALEAASSATLTGNGVTGWLQQGDALTLSGSGNTINGVAGDLFYVTGGEDTLNGSSIGLTLAANTSVISSGTGNGISLNGGDTVRINNGADTVVDGGTTNTIALSTGSEAVFGSSGGIGFITGSSDNTVITTGAGYQADHGFSMANHDRLDLSQILQGTGATASDLAHYVTVSDNGSDTTLAISSPTGSDTVVLVGVGASNLAALIGGNAFVYPTH